jgi:hypothetical protein
MFSVREREEKTSEETSLFDIAVYLLLYRPSTAARGADIGNFDGCNHRNFHRGNFLFEKVFCSAESGLKCNRKNVCRIICYIQ